MESAGGRAVQAVRQEGENESKRASWTRESLPTVYLKLKQPVAAAAAAASSNSSCRGGRGVYTGGSVALATGYRSPDYLDCPEVDLNTCAVALLLPLVIYELARRGTKIKSIK